MTLYISAKERTADHPSDLPTAFRQIENYINALRGPTPTAPTGGAVIDVQACTAINQIIALLQQFGFVP